MKLTSCLALACLCVLVLLGDAGAQPPLPASGSNLTLILDLRKVPSELRSEVAPRVVLLPVDGRSELLPESVKRVAGGAELWVLYSGIGEGHLSVSLPNKLQGFSAWISGEEEELRFELVPELARVEVWAPPSEIGIFWISMGRLLTGRVLQVEFDLSCCDPAVSKPIQRTSIEGRTRFEYWAGHPTRISVNLNLQDARIEEAIVPRYDAAHLSLRTAGRLGQTAGVAKVLLASVHARSWRIP